MDDADPGLLRWVGGCLPRADDIGQEAGAGRVGFIDAPVAGLAVPADCGARHENLRGGVELRDCLDDRAGAINSAVEDLTLVVIGPAMVADPGAGEVHDGLGALELGEVDGAGSWIPGYLVGGRARPAHEAHDLVALGAQMGDEGGADEPGRAGDCNLHGPSIPHPAADARAAPALHPRCQRRGVVQRDHPDRRAPCVPPVTKSSRQPTRRTPKLSEWPSRGQLACFRGADSPERPRFAAAAQIHRIRRSGRDLRGGPAPSVRGVLRDSRGRPGEVGGDRRALRRGVA